MTWKTTQLQWSFPTRQHIEIQLGENAYFKSGSNHQRLALGHALELVLDHSEAIIIFQRISNHFSYFNLSTNAITFGRNPQCDLVYTFEAVSKQHCRLEKRENEWWIIDLNSRNGVYVNNRRVKETLLHIGDHLFLAGYECWFNPLFIVVNTPQKTTLAPYIYHQSLSDLHEVSKITDFGMLVQPEYPQPSKLLEKKHHFSLSGDLLIPLIYPMLWLSNGQFQHPMLYAPILIVVIRLCGLFLAECKRLLVNTRKQCRYRQILKQYYNQLQHYQPDCLGLEESYLTLGKSIERDGAFTVRLGMRGKEVFCHDFSVLSHLVLVGDETAIKNCIRQILYQVYVYYPQIGVAMDQWPEDDSWWLTLTTMPSQIIGVGKNQAGSWDGWIEPVSSLDACRGGFDALLDLNNGVYYTHTKKVNVVLDNVSHPYLFCQAFKYKRRQNQGDFSYLSLLGLDVYHISYLRKQYHIEREVIGCIGSRGTEPLYLDLHEKEAGPHLLVTGMTGSGKSEWLLSYLLSLAVFYDSSDLQFFIIDFKGGGLTASFEKLHHTTMVLSNLEMQQIVRAIAALEDELLVREALLLKVSRQTKRDNLSIHDLNAMYRKKEITEHLSHLLIVVDEFAELKMLYPDILQALIRISRVGRSLGLHLILATQRPSGIVDRQILGNMKAKVCLRVAQKQDAYDIFLEKCDAHLLPVGAFYLQTGENQALIYGEGKMVQPVPQKILMYEKYYTKQQQILLKQANMSLLYQLIQKINEVSQICEPLYFKDFPSCKKNNGDLLLCDDFVHRQMFKINRPINHTKILLIGVNPMIKEQFLSHHAPIHQVLLDKTDLKEQEDILVIEDFSLWGGYDYGVVDRVKGAVFFEKENCQLTTRFLDKMDIVVWLSEVAVKRMVEKKYQYPCDIQRQIGVVLWKGRYYRCQIL